MKSEYLVAFGVASTLTLSGCGGGIANYPSESYTDAEMQRILSETEDPATLEDTYHIMQDDEGADVGVIFVHSVSNNEYTSSTCAKYRAFDGSTSEQRAMESANRTTCLANDLS